jgi:MFS family permease
MGSNDEKGFSARFWLLISATFLGFLGMGTVLPAMAPHVRFDMGGSDRMVGWVIGTFSFVALGGRFFSGPLADRRGRKITFMAGLASCACAGVAYLLPLNLAGVFLGRSLQGFGEACLYTGAAAWAVEVAGVERSGQTLGYLSSAIWGGVSAGPAIGHWVGSFQHAAMLQIFTASAGCGLAYFVDEHFQPSPHHHKRVWLPLSILKPGFAMGFVNVHYPVITGFLILHLAQHGDSGRAAFSAYALTILCSRFFLGRLPDRIHPSITFYAGLLFMSGGLVWLGSGPAPFFAICAAVMLGFGFSFPWASVASTVLRRTPSNQHGSIISLLSAFYDLFVGMSSFAAGTVAQKYGYPPIFYWAAGCLTVSAVLGRFVFFPYTPPTAPPASLEQLETVV